MYIYIYCHPQTDSFVLSELFRVARHAGRSKPGSKPTQLYVRLSVCVCVCAMCVRFKTLNSEVTHNFKLLGLIN